MHFPEHRYYIRRMRIGSNSDLIKPMKEAGYKSAAEYCRKALDMRVTSKEVVLNLLNRDQDQDPAPDMAPPSHLILKQEPVSDCRRYDRLLREGYHVTQ